MVFPALKDSVRGSAGEKRRRPARFFEKVGPESVNEELLTLNAEFQNKIDELADAHNMDILLAIEDVTSTPGTLAEETP